MIENKQGGRDFEILELGNFEISFKQSSSYSIGIQAISKY